MRDAIGATDGWDLGLRRYAERLATLSRPACRRQVEGRAITSRGEVQAAEQSRKA
jgi:hypothetical protein